MAAKVLNQKQQNNAIYVEPSIKIILPYISLGLLVDD